MKLTSNASGMRANVRLLHAVLLGLFALPMIAGIGIASYFWLSSDADALRDSFLSAVDRDCHRKIVLNVGGFTTGAARLGLSFFDVPPEARMAAKSIHGAEVAVYQLEKDFRALDHTAIIDVTDLAMQKRGWERVLGVATDSELVAVYIPKRLDSAARVRCLVLAVHEKDAVIVGARGNLVPLMEFAQKQIPWTSLLSERMPR